MLFVLVLILVLVLVVDTHVLVLVVACLVFVRSLVGGAEHYLEALQTPIQLRAVSTACIIWRLRREALKKIFQRAKPRLALGILKCRKFR